MKKIVSFLTVLLAVLLLVSCAKNDNHTAENCLGTYTIHADVPELTLYLIEDKDGGAVLDVCIMQDGKEETLQSLLLTKNSEYYAELALWLAHDQFAVQDMNFDGYDDLYVPCCALTANLENIVFLWDTQKEEFVLSDQLSRIHELTVLPEEQLLRGCERIDGTVYTDYRIIDGVPVAVTQ